MSRNGQPDITDASRRMKASEFEKCQEAGVKEITEVRIDFDGIAVANSKAAPELNLSLRDHAGIETVCEKSHPWDFGCAHSVL